MHLYENIFSRDLGEAVFLVLLSRAVQPHNAMAIEWHSTFVLAAQSSCQIDLSHLRHCLAVVLFNEFRLLGALEVDQILLCWTLLRMKVDPCSLLGRSEPV